MPVERHFVGAGRFRDGVHPDRADAMAVKQLARGGDDTLARRQAVRHVGFGDSVHAQLLGS
jgi:hypothetical protein